MYIKDRTNLKIKTQNAMRAVQKLLRSALVPVVTIVAGISLILLTQAATQSVSFEVEAGMPSMGARSETISGASGNTAIRFAKPMSMDNDLGSFLYNSSLTARYRQYESASESEVASNLTARGNFEASPGGYQSHNSQGQFRFYCQYSHFAYDDPIVYPKINGIAQGGKSHLHMFWGNTQMNASTTDDNIMTRGGGSCPGYEGNRTGYWMPAVIDGNNKVVIPKTILMYYKSAQNAAAQTKKMPKGLKMIAGNPNGNTDTSLQHVNGVIWACYTGSINYTYIGNTIPDSCPPNTQNNIINSYTRQKAPEQWFNSIGQPVDTYPILLQALVFFPACVQIDGSGKPVLDSSDHKSHVKYFSGNTCPASHPYMMPQVSYHIMYPGDQNYSQWKLSSDQMAGVADGFSLHADWYGGWVDEVQDHWIKGCINLQLNCSDGVMAPGGGFPHRQLKKVGDYTGPNNLTIPTSR